MAATFLIIFLGFLFVMVLFYFFILNLTKNISIKSFVNTQTKEAVIIAINDLPYRPGKMSEKEILVEFTTGKENIHYAKFRLYNYLFQGDDFTIGKSIEVKVSAVNEKIVMLQYNTKFGKGTSISIKGT